MALAHQACQGKQAFAPARSMACSADKVDFWLVRANDRFLEHDIANTFVITEKEQKDSRIWKPLLIMNRLSGWRSSLAS